MDEFIFFLRERNIPETTIKRLEEDKVIFNKLINLLKNVRNSWPKNENLEEVTTYHLDLLTNVFLTEII